MVKPKKRHVRCAPGRKLQNQGSPEIELLDEEEWVVVKKQKITIIIPPLPSKVQSTMPSVGEGQLLETPRKCESQSPRINNSEVQVSSGVSASKQSGNATAKSISSSPEQAVHPPITLHPSEPKLTVQKPSSLCHGVFSDNSPHQSSRGCKDIDACGPSKGNKRIMLFADGSAFLNQRMRACYLEKKLKKAGGLENWLVSLGLTCFIKVFQRRNVNRFQLANLTMKKLKDMGTDAVGPRRKLMHAIECICEPHCFQRL